MAFLIPCEPDRIKRCAGRWAGTLTDNNMEDMLKEVRQYYLKQINYRIVKEFLDEIRTKSRGRSTAERRTWTTAR